MENNYNQNNETMSYKDWMVTMGLMYIPFVNIILTVIWALDKGGNQNRANFCKAKLTFMAIGLVAGILISITMGGIFAAILRNI